MKMMVPRVVRTLVQVDNVGTASEMMLGIHSVLVCDGINDD